MGNFALSLNMKSRGIVIRTIKYGETSIITDIFTEDKGLATFIGGSVRTARSRMPMGLFQPMSPVEFICYWKSDVTAMHRLKECRPDVVRTGIPFDLGRGSVALFMAEVLRKCLQTGEVNTDLFEYLTNTLYYLDSTQNPISHIYLHFLVQLSGHLGFHPQMDEEGVYFDLREGATTDVQPIHGQSLSKEETKKLVALSTCDLSEVHHLQFSRADRKAMLQKLLLYYQLHIPGFDNIHTPDVLENVF
jgi:DNA repair protein RecO (recombination protein O)